MRAVSAAALVLPAAAAAYGVDCSAPSDFGDVADCSAGMTTGKLCKVKCDSGMLHPTQAAVGMQLVTCKVSKFNGKKKSKMQKYLSDPSHWVPGVKGSDAAYVTDHHHLLAALCRSDYKDNDVYFCPRLDFSNTTGDAFWDKLLAFDPPLAYLQNERGVLISPSQVPSTVFPGVSADDPYRSLSALVLDQGGFVKCDKDLFTAWKQCANATGTSSPPFLENRWADVLRPAVPLPGIYAEKPKDQIGALVNSVKAGIAECQSSAHKSMVGFNRQPQLSTGCEIDEPTGCDCKSGP